MNKSIMLLAMSLIFAQLAFGQGDNELRTLKLQRTGSTSLGTQGIATVSASCSVFLSNDYFHHADYPSFRIRISTDQSILRALPSEEIVTLKGPYELNIRAIVPSINIEGAALVTNGRASAHAAGLENLFEMVTSIDEKWQENRRSSGIARLKTGRWPNPGVLDLIKYDALIDFRADVAAYTPHLKSEISLLTDIPVFAGAGYFDDDVLNLVARVAAAKNLNDIDKEERQVIAKEIRNLVNSLGEKTAILAIWATAKVEKSGASNDTRDVATVTFLNVETWQYIRFFIYEGQR